MVILDAASKGSDGLVTAVVAIIKCITRSWQEVRAHICAAQYSTPYLLATAQVSVLQPRELASETETMQRLRNLVRLCRLSAQWMPSIRSVPSTPATQGIGLR